MMDNTKHYALYYNKTNEFVASTSSKEVKNYIVNRGRFYAKKVDESELITLRLLQQYKEEQHDRYRRSQLR